ncbi:hypothetical protein O7623_29270 [Solwaraspora sp. WMMD791]|uniref:hypothetical protein n=1 Tax=Solwaraspora sp. WMMD791 TaxID=3016086 RepID=UPI002499DDA1|nr:hypothetical protein [Solwaraspora sp. WMMD791]WFE27282.1 hypothetical protein O7623_29270 [Solwaraspora sp. WMMD791]
MLMSWWQRGVAGGTLTAALALGGVVLGPTSDGWAQPTPQEPGPELVAVTINEVGQSAPTYQVEAINRTVAPVDVTVRLGVPDGTSVATVGSGGHADGTEITWQLSLPASGGETVNASFRPGGTGATQNFPVCVYQRDTARPYDCAVARWTSSAGIAAADRAWWQRPSLPLLAGLGALVVVTMVGYGWRRRLQEHRVDRRRVVTTGRRRVRLPSAPPPAPPPSRRWRPSTPMVFGLLIAMFTGLAVAAVRGATYGSEVLDQANQVPSGWIGSTESGGFGVLLTETAFEFTVFRMACVPAGGQDRRCLATVGLRNRSDEEQYWYAPLQRAYLPTGDWVAVDEAATRQENGGRDIFAAPIPAGARLLVPLAFTVSGELMPEHLELRSGAFSAGVAVR